MDCVFSGIERIGDSVLDLVDLDLGSTSDLNDTHSTDKLGETLLELLLVVFGGGNLDLVLDKLHSLIDLFPIGRKSKPKGLKIKGITCFQLRPLK